MAGLLSSMGSQSAPADTPAPSDSGMDDSDEDGKQPNVSPEEQQAYDTFVQNGLDVIYGHGNAPSGAGQGGDIPGITSMQAPSGAGASPPADPSAQPDPNAAPADPNATPADPTSVPPADPTAAPADPSAVPPADGSAPPPADPTASVGAPSAAAPPSAPPSSGASQGARPDILNRLKESTSPIVNLSNTAVWLVTALETSAEKAKAPWTQDDQMKSDIIMHGGQALMEELADVSQAAGIHDFSDKELQGAWYQALDLYRQTATDAGQLDAGSLKAQFGQIQTADEKGDIDSVVPGLSQVKKDS